MLLRLDQGFSHPHVVRYKNGKDEDMEDEEEQQDSEDKNSDEESEEELSN